jgi:hypothetical protein
MNRAVNAKMSRQAAAKDASGLANRQRTPKPSGRISACSAGFLAAVKATKRKTLIMTALWTEACKATVSE